MCVACFFDLFHGFLDSPKWKKTPTLVTVPVGTPAKLICKVVSKSKPTIEWLKNGALITKQNKRIESTYRLTTQNDDFFTLQNVLSIQQTTESDSANYTCHAENEVDFLNVNYQLRVITLDSLQMKSFHIKPQVISKKCKFAIRKNLPYNVFSSIASLWFTNINKRKQNHEVPAGNSLTLSCSSDGDPKPVDILWFKDGVPFYARSNGEDVRLPILSKINHQ